MDHRDPAAAVRDAPREGPPRRPGPIRSFAYDVVTVEIDPGTARVVSARRYKADELHTAFRARWEASYRHVNSSFATWGGPPENPYDRGWIISTEVPYDDITEAFGAA